MVTNYQTESGYLVEFPQGLDLEQARILTRLDRSSIDQAASDNAASDNAASDKKGAFNAVPYVIRGKPGLLNVRFQFRKQGNEAQDVYNEDFAMVLRPSGMFTNFRGKTDELKGELTIPHRYFPVEIVSIKIQNLSNRFD